MSAFEEKALYFKNKMKEAVDLEAEIKPRVIALQEEAEKKIGAIREQFEADKAALLMPLETKLQTYKAEVKAWCGITDGERFNVVQTLEAVKKVLGE